MYKYWCTNNEHDPKPKFYFGETNDIKECPDCGAPLKLLGEIVNFYAKIGSMSPAQKQQALLERSREHSQRNGEIKDRKEKLHRDVGLNPK